MSEAIAYPAGSPVAEALGGAIAPIRSGFERELTGRVGLRTAITHTLVMARRHLIKMRRNIEQFGDVAIQPILFTVMFTYVFGGAIAGNTSAYLPYLIPGILVQTVISTSVVTGTQMREDMDNGVFDRFRCLPMARMAPLAGALLADTVRYLLAALMTLACGMAIGYRPGGGVLGVAAGCLLVIAVSWAVSWIFALLGVLARSAAAVQGLSIAVLFPLTFVSNVFVRAETMPGWLQGFVRVNPISHMVTAARELMGSGHVGMDVLWSLAGAAVLVLVLAPLTVRAYMRRG